MKAIAQCHEYFLITIANIGSKINCPVAVLAVNNPTARPLLFSNHRFATYGLNTVKNTPDPNPIIMPQITINCHCCSMNKVKIRPTNKVNMDTTIIFFKPITSINAAMNGPDMPYKNKPMAKANEMTERSQPNSFSKGSINTPDDDLIIPATMMEKNEMSKITQL